MKKKKTIELRRGSTAFPHLPNPEIERPCLFVKFPYLEVLVDSIKAIDWRLRKFDRAANTWLVVEVDPNQAPDEAEPLDYLRGVCRDAAADFDWKFDDYTAKGEEAIAQAAQVAQEEFLEAHVAAVIAALPQIGPGGLKVVAWGRETIKLQLNHFIGQEAWHQLKEACTSVWKPGMLMLGSGQRMDFGFVFEMAADDRIIDALASHGGVKNLKRVDLEVERTFEDGVAHLRDQAAELWIGTPLSESDPGQINWGTQPWEIANVNGMLHWVVQVESFVLSWLEETSYSVIFMAVLNKQRSALERLLPGNYLEQWFQAWGRRLLAEPLDTIKLSQFGEPHFFHAWQHPADPLIKGIKKFPSNGLLDILEINPLTFAQQVAEIDSEKQRRAEEALEERRAGAIDTVMSKMVCESKDLLLRLAGDRAKKSWTKERIAREIVTQEYAEKKLRLPSRRP